MSGLSMQTAKFVSGDTYSNLKACIGTNLLENTKIHSLRVRAMPDASTRFDISDPDSKLAHTRKPICPRRVKNWY